jgi:hypothetical protein
MHPSGFRLAILSDSHGYIDQQILSFCTPCQAIWHAGDIGDATVLQHLATVAPVTAVYGNIDDTGCRTSNPETIVQTIHGCKMMMTHIAGKPGVYTKQVQSSLLAYKPTILVCGHSHIAKAWFDPTYQVLYLNPGAIGFQGFHMQRTMMRLEISTEGKPKNLELIELGPKKRGL